MFNRTLALRSLVKGGEVQPHWREDGTSFWFTEEGSNGPAMWICDAEKGGKVPFLDLERLRSALVPIVGHNLPLNRLPFDSFNLLPGEAAARLKVDGREFILRLKSYKVEAEPDAEQDRHTPRLLKKAEIVGPPPAYEVISPDGAWFLGSQNGNLYVRSTSDGHKQVLTTDGSSDYGWDYGWDSIPLWAPDSRALVARKTDLRDRVLSRYPIMHWLKTPPDVEWATTGSTGTKTENYILNIASRKLSRIDQGAGGIHLRAWRPDGSEVLFTQSGPKKIDLVAADRSTGENRLVFTERNTTFLDVALTLPNSPNFNALEDNRRFLWLSERDGWNQIYVVGYDGTVLKKLTDAQRPVERIAAVDEKNGWVYYTAHGGEGHPYDLNLYRVSLDGGRTMRLTDAPGQHDLPVYDAYLGAKGVGIQFAPSRRFFLDVHSDVNRPPETDLRRADGTLVKVLSKSNADAATALAPNPPEEFTAKAADGSTDLYGILYKPYDFDPEKKYPVVDFIYGGPQMMRVPRIFAASAREQAFANLGLIVIVVDARGTPGRGKVFQDVVAGNIGRNEIPDHAAVLSQLSAFRNYIDMTRVGVLGGSFGGYFAIRAMLQAPDVFRVGIAMAAGEVDNTLKLWMGGPKEENTDTYEFASNYPLAKNLQGHLLLIHGTSDLNAPFASTVRMIDALQRANKGYDLVILPEQDHSAQNSTYSLQAVKRYLVEHLKP